MEKTVETMCSVCHGKHPCRHFDLYVFGSEGIWLCHGCEMTVVEFIRQIRADALEKAKRDYLYRIKEAE